MPGRGYWIRVARFCALSLFVVSLLAAGDALACPFCTAQLPTLSQQQAASTVTALAEVENASGAGPVSLRLHRLLKGEEALGAAKRITASLDLAVRPGGLVLLFGSRNAEGGFDWHAVAVDEVSYAYFARAPRLQESAAERLAYFAPYLEHANPVVAEDAYLEFAHAPFDLVASAADLLPMARMSRWLTDPNVPGHRKGLYGLALGLATSPEARRANAEPLRELILTPEDDFRAGFDGILGGYLLLEGTRGLQLIETRYLANPEAAVGDVRHAMTALRFYHEYGREITPEQLAEAMRHLLARPEFAEAAIIDLARWQDWGAVAEVAALYGKAGYDQQGTQRSIVGYLLACPLPAARESLAILRESDPEGVRAAEAVLSRTGSIPRSE